MPGVLIEGPATSEEDHCRDDGNEEGLQMEGLVNGHGRGNHPSPKLGDGGDPSEETGSTDSNSLVRFGRELRYEACDSASPEHANTDGSRNSTETNPTSLDILGVAEGLPGQTCDLSQYVSDWLGETGGYWVGNRGVISSGASTLVEPTPSGPDQHLDLSTPPSPSETIRQALNVPGSSREVELTPMGVTRENTRNYTSTQYRENLAMGADSDVEITVGVELETILRDLESGTMAEHYNLISAALKPLAEELETYVLVILPGQHFKGDNPGVGPLPMLKERNATFQVHEDLTIRDHLSKFGRPIEISTPILRGGNWESTIIRMFQIIKDSFEVDFNPTTGLHVHIGIGRGYKLQDLKRIAKAVVLFEKQMDQYHPESRCLSPVPGRLFTQGLLSSIQIFPCRSSKPLRGLSNIEMVKVIDKAENMLDLFRTINSAKDDWSLEKDSPPYRGYRYNLSSFLKYKTVEFRQAIGTVDGDATVDWIGRTIKFVTSAIATPDCTFECWANCGIPYDGIYYQFGVPPPGYC